MKVIFLNTKKTLLALSLVFFVSSGIVYPQTVQASAWGEALAASMLKQAMEQIRDGINGTILGAVKTAAATAMANQIDRLIGGTGLNQPLYVRDYDRFLREDPLDQARVRVYSFLTETYRGVESSSNFQAAGGASSVKGNYAAQLTDQAKKAVEPAQIRYTFHEECGEYDRLKNEGSIKCLIAYNKPGNNPFSAAYLAEQEYRQEYYRLRYENQIKLTSSGFLPYEQNGKVITPSSSIATLYNDTKTLGQRILEGAQNPAELASGVVFALINRSINTIAYKAAGAVESVVDKTVGKAVTEINKVASDAGSIIRTADGYIIDANGYVTEAGYYAEQAEKLKSQANGNTPAPQAPLPGG